MSGDYERVRYAPGEPTWHEVRSSDVPVFAAAVSLRGCWSTVLRELASEPRALRAMSRADVSARVVARYLVWRETARCFGVRSLVDDDPTAAVLSRLLPEAGPPPADVKPSITGVVITKDERPRLAAALQSLSRLADELVVVDDDSTDGTAELASELGAVVVRRSLAGDFAAQRNAGLSRVRTDWVLTIDADEVLDPGLVTTLDHAARWGRADVVFAPLLNQISERGEEPVLWPQLRPTMFRSHLTYSGALHERLMGWRRPVFAPLSVPFVVHRKDLARQHRATLLYDAIDTNSPYPPDLIAGVREELAALEQKDTADDGDEFSA